MLSKYSVWIVGNAKMLSEGGENLDETRHGCQSQEPLPQFER